MRRLITQLPNPRRQNTVFHQGRNGPGADFQQRELWEGVSIGRVKLLKEQVTAVWRPDRRPMMNGKRVRQRPCFRAISPHQPQLPPGGGADGLAAKGDPVPIR